MPLFQPDPSEGPGWGRSRATHAGAARGWQQAAALPRETLAHPPAHAAAGPFSVRRRPGAPAAPFRGRRLLSTPGGGCSSPTRRIFLAGGGQARSPPPRASLRYKYRGHSRLLWRQRGGGRDAPRGRCCRCPPLRWGHAAAPELPWGVGGGEAEAADARGRGPETGERAGECLPLPGSCPRPEYLMPRGASNRQLPPEPQPSPPAERRGEAAPPALTNPKTRRWQRTNQTVAKAVALLPICPIAGRGRRAPPSVVTIRELGRRGLGPAVSNQRCSCRAV